MKSYAMQFHNDYASSFDAPSLGLRLWFKSTVYISDDFLMIYV